MDTTRIVALVRARLSMNAALHRSAWAGAAAAYEARGAALPAAIHFMRATEPVVRDFFVRADEPGVDDGEPSQEG
jgi:hypothetical protein